MILIDANLLIYAYDPDCRQHDDSRQWLEDVLSGVDVVRFTWPTIWAFIRISTSPRVFVHPLSTAEAHAAVAAWLQQPNAGIIDPAERHLDILSDLLDSGQVTGAQVMDAVLAAIAVEHGATLCSTDRDFSKFKGLDWTNPLEP